MTKLNVNTTNNAFETLMLELYTFAPKSTSLSTFKALVFQEIRQEFLLKNKSVFEPLISTDGSSIILKIRQPVYEHLRATVANHSGSGAQS